jgi:hypothetical protein
MSYPTSNIADRMLANDINSRMLRAERDRIADERRARVNREYERALSSSSSEDESACKCRCKCNAEPLSKEEIEYRADLMKRLEKFDRESQARWEAFDRRRKEESICTIL